MRGNKAPVTKEKALDKLTTLCSRGEQCEFELNRKMLNWGLNSSDRKEIIEYLKTNRFLDEARYARSYANDKARFSAWGPAKIHAELMLRRISTPSIREALNSVEPAIWKEGLLRCASSKARNLNLLGEESWENSQKLYRYIISRGFPSSAASKAVTYMKKKQEENE